MGFYILIGILILVLFFFFFTFNNLVRLNNKVKEAFSTMDVYLKKRWDLIPNLVEVVKGYAKHESETLESIVKARNTYEAMSLEEKIETNEKISSGIQKIMLLAESYPELKASENFKDLSHSLTQVEEDIANSRKYYNGTVRLYNNKVEIFPCNIVAKVCGFKKKELFSIDVNERNNVKVEL